MRVETISLASGTYTYLVIDDSTGQAAVVDPGEAEPVQQRLDELGVTLVQLWHTHHHIDHSGGAARLRERYPDIRVFAHKSEVDRLSDVTDVLDDMEPAGRWREGHEPVHIPTSADAKTGLPGKDDFSFQLGNESVRVLHVPGHTSGSVAYHVGDCLFTGDALLGGGTSRNVECNVDVLMKSLNDKIASLPPDTKTYYGREWTRRNLEFAALLDRDNQALTERLERLRTQPAPSVPGSIGLELETNPFLRLASGGLKEHVLGPHFEPDTPFYVFSRLLQMRERALPPA